MRYQSGRKRRWATEQEVAVDRAPCTGALDDAVQLFPSVEDDVLPDCFYDSGRRWDVPGQDRSACAKGKVDRVTCGGSLIGVQGLDDEGTVRRYRDDEELRV